MSDDTKKSHDDKLKLKVALAMIKADKSVDIICREFNISTCQAYAWKQHLEEHGSELFADKRKVKKEETYDKILADLEQVKEERNFLVQVLSR